MIWLAVGAGGAIGSIARHEVNVFFGHVLERAVPYATAAVNLLGSLAIGENKARAAGKPEPAEAPVQSAAGGFVVQLGAFASEPNAKSFLQHMQERLAAAADIAPRVREAGGLYRVYVGPYPTRDDARRTADRLASAFGLATAIAPH